MKFAMEHQNPLVCGNVISKGAGPYPETTYSLLSLSDPNVLLWAVKPAEDGIDKGVVVRLWNLSDDAARTTIKMETGIGSANRTSHIETDLESVPVNSDGGVSASFARQQLQTFRLTIPSFNSKDQTETKTPN